MATAGQAPQCCCGQPDCAFLALTCRTLQGLERDVKTAAELGQALLIRHEAYMADAEAERRRMTTSIERLEHEKQELEADNARKIEENRLLLDQLEGVNKQVSESDEHIKSLEAALQTTQQEIHRLTVLAARAETLECQLLQLESEQVSLQQSLEESIEDEQGAVRRWKQAERTIISLQDQIERIEREARADREQHVEVIQRMERRKAVEMELHAAAGRLKGAAASKTADGSRGGSSVVSHFVRDILQDNANLQQAIVELRELLLGSNDEVEKLRQQLMIHQPLERDAEGNERPNLLKELEREASRTPEVHVHLHHHAPETKAKNSVQHRRSKKRRSVIIGSGNPSSAYHSARSSVSSAKGEPVASSSAAAILANTAVSIPTRHKHQWSFQSGTSVASSSLPNSPPYSDYRRSSSVFDRVFSDAGMESSRPTSPESDYLDSPMFGPVQRTALPAPPTRCKSTPLIRNPKSPTSAPLNPFSIDGMVLQNELPEPGLDITNLPPAMSPSAILEEPEDTDLLLGQETTSSFESPEFFPSSGIRHKLRKANSHDSLLSISGMDIHTLKSRPSQLLRADTASSNIIPVLGATTTIATAARPTPVRMVEGGSLKTLRGSLLSGNAADQRAASSKSKWGWNWGIWGTSLTPPARSDLMHDTPRNTNDSGDSGRNAQKQSKTLPTPRKLRPPGINQPGPIWGMGPEPATPFITRVVSLDHDALREGLSDGI